MDTPLPRTEIPNEKFEEIVDLLNLLNENDQLIVYISGRESEAVEIKDIYFSPDMKSAANYLVLSLQPPLSEEKKAEIRSLAREKKEHEA